MENENKPKNKRRYYKRKSRKVNTSEVLDASIGPAPSVATDGVATESPTGKPKTKYKRKPKPKTDPKTIAWEDATRLTAAERGIDQIGLPALPKWTEPKKSAIEDANITDRYNIATVDNSYASTDTKLVWSINNSDNKEQADACASKSDHLFAEYKLLSAIALIGALLGICVVAAVWWLLTR